jgi:hypothetical protein
MRILNFILMLARWTAELTKRGLEWLIGLS